jgi:hypothetical protein
LERIEALSPSKIESSEHLIAYTETRMKILVLTAIVGLALCSLAAQTPSTKSGEKLVGTWRLVSRVVTSEDGRVLSDAGLGATPVGLLTYDSTGHMAVQEMRPNRPAMGDCGVSAVDVANNTQTV